MNISFAFDEQSYKILGEMKELAGFSSDAEMVREALRIMRTLQELARAGYSEVIVRQEDTGRQKLLEINVLADQPLSLKTG